MIPLGLCLVLLPAPAAAEDGLTAVRTVRAAEPFVLDTPYRYEWSAERPEVTGGVVLTLEVAPEWLRVRDIGQPVLFVGAVPAEVVRRDPDAGLLWVVVPGALSPEVPIWFGAPLLPERVTAADGARELATAQAAGLRPLAVPQRAVARRVADHEALAALAVAPLLP